jgi:glyoxylase-like metal-dependent hydrolase (beta-lactamase superfamily II)
MNLHIVDAGCLKLDGGAIFGVVPKTIWNKTNPADENNLCRIAMRCLLIEDGDRLILIDTGIGSKQGEKFFRHYYLYGETKIEKALNKAGFSAEDVTDVFLTHLHFDHVGGAVRNKDEGPGSFSLTFPDAIYWSNQAHWQWAIEPNAREKASFLKENLMPLYESGNLKFIDIDRPSPFAQFDILYFDGHTEKQMIPSISYKNKKIVFAADILPTVGHIPLPYVMAYDTRPLITLVEKDEFLNNAADQKLIIYFEHDPDHECCTLKHTERGVRLDNTFSLKEVLN